MDLYHTAIFMFIGSFIINYFITTSLFLDNIHHFRNSLNRFYLALYKSLWMLIISTGIFLFFNNEPHPFFLFAIVIAILIVFFLTRYQVGVNDKQYVNTLIQVHSDTLLTTRAIIRKTRNPKIKALAEDIYKRNEEILAELIKKSH